MSYGDVYQIKLKSHYLDKEILNVFYYKWNVLDIGGSAQTWAVYFSELVLPNILPLVNDRVNFYEVESINIRNVGDFYVHSIDFDGDIEVVDTEALPAFMALGFRYNRIAPGQRSGFKRFTGLVDDQVSGDSFIGDTGDVALLVNALQTPLAGAGREAAPFIVKRSTLEYGVNPAGYIPATVTFQGITTQNTRK